MIQSIYTLVSNANLVPCNRKNVVKSDPIPLLRNNYLGEYRTALEKAKVRKNLGIADEVVMEWGNLSGFIENLKDLVAYVEDKWHYTLPDDITNITEELTNVQDAINYAIKYVSTFKSDTDSIIFLKGEAEKLNTQVANLDSRISKGETDIKSIQGDIETINGDIKKLNESLLAINVDANILEWVKNHTSNSIILTDNGLEVKIAESENNALKLDATGLHVNDLSLQVSLASLDILNLSENVNTILDTYVTKEQLGGEGDFNFANQEDFTTYVEQTNTKINNINLELDRTVKTGEDGHVDTLYVNLISKNNDDGNIKITDSFEVESGIPLDVRFVVENLDELHSLPVKVCYEGMGVIVNSLSSLYILRKPSEGIEFNLEYIQNPNNWKCPEDLITVALTRDLYDSLEEINPHVFYYIYEEEITRTQEPKREEYETEEEFYIAWLEWVNSLKTLSQEYMSASWGADIEEKVSKKADNTIVSNLGLELFSLQLKVDTIIGGEEGSSLAVLEGRLSETESDLEYLLGTEHTDEQAGSKGKIKEIEESIQNLDTTISSTYVTKESITDENSLEEYIFVKKSAFNEYVESHSQQISESISTKIINTNQIAFDSDVLTAEEGLLAFNNNAVALDKQVPKILVLSNDEYMTLDKDENTYYYVYDEENSYVTKEIFSNYQANLSKSLTNLYNNITNLIGNLLDLTTTDKSNIVLAINELVSKILELTNEVAALKESAST